MIKADASDRRAKPILSPEQLARWAPVVLAFSAVVAVSLLFSGGVDRSGLLGAWIGVMALLVLAARRGAFDGWRPDWVGGIAILMLIWLFASQRWSQFRFLSSDEGYVLGTLPACYLLARSLPPAVVGQIIISIRYIAIPLLLFAIAEFAVTRSRPAGIFLDANVLAAFTNAVFFPAYAEWLAAGKFGLPAPRGAALTSVLGVVALITTTSLAGLLCFLPLFVTVSLLDLRLGRGQMKVIGTVVALLILSYTVVYSMQTGRGSPVSRIVAEARSGGHATLHQGSFLHERIAMDRSALLIAADYPWLGSGPGTFKTLYLRYRSPEDRSSAGNYAHDDYLQFLAEGGPVLLVCLIGLLAGFLVRATDAIRALFNAHDEEGHRDAWLSVGVISALSAMFAHAFVNFIFYVPSMSVISGIYIAAVRSSTCGPISDPEKPPLLPARIGWLMYAAAVAILTVSLALPTFFSLITNDRCRLHICQELGAQQSKMVAFANLLSAVYPSWISAPEYLAAAATAAAKDVKNGGDRQNLIRTAVNEYLQIVRYSPAYPFVYRYLGDLVRQYPEVSALLPDTVPHDYLTLYQRAATLNPLDYAALVEWVRALTAKGRNDEAVSVVERANRFRDLAIVPPPDQAALLRAGLPSALRLGRCSDAQAMAEAILVIGAEPIPVLAHKLADQAASPAVDEMANVASSNVPGCGLAPQDYALPAAVVPAQSR